MRESCENIGESCPRWLAALLCNILQELQVKEFSVNVSAGIIAHLCVVIPALPTGNTTSIFLVGSNKHHIDIRVLLSPTLDQGAANQQGPVAWIILKCLFETLDNAQMVWLQIQFPIPFSMKYVFPKKGVFLRCSC